MTHLTASARHIVFVLLAFILALTGKGACAADSSYFMSMSVPTTMYAGRSYPATVVMRNNGTLWATGRGYKLTSMNPAGNTTWGLSAIDLGMATENNEDAQFDFTVTAPTTPGTYTFIWTMTRNGVQFGGIASGSDITVIAEGSTAPPGTTPPPDAPPVTTPPVTTPPAVNMAAVMAAVQMLLDDDTPPVPVVPTTVALALPSAGATIAPGATATFSMTVGGPNTTAVKLYANGLLLGNAQGSGTAWTYSWLTDIASAYTLVAKAFDANGALLAESAPVSITVSLSTSGNGGTLVPVSIVPPHLGNPDAGTLPGALDVSSSGAAAYAIDLVVPPGTNGMQPALSLNYSGNGLNGLFGLGWSITGLSSVHRCGKTIAQDGVNERISFSHTDRLCLDGQRLLLANRALSDDNYWAVGAQYRTEIESFTRVTLENLGPGGALSFKVETKDGRISTYGTTGNSSVAAIIGAVNSGVGGVQPTVKSGPQSWAIARTEDRYRNFISFSYQQDGVTGEHRPAFIRYGGFGFTSHAAVQFEYETRQDAWKRFIDESRNDLRSRVTHIRTYVGDDLNGDNVAASGNLVRDYTLSYEYSLTSGRSLLAAIGVCALHPVSGQMDCIKETTFEWGKPNKAPGFVSRGIWAGAPILTTHNVSASGSLMAVNHSDYFAFSDIDHDGLTDVLEKRVASMRPSDLNTPDGSYREASNPILPGTLRDSYRYFRNVGGSFLTYTYKLSTGLPFVVLDVGDFNGDGALDLLAYSQTGTRICTSPLAATAPGAAGSTITFQCGALLGGWRNEPGGRAYIFDPLGNGKSAAYTAIADRKARFCTIDECLTDTNPPFVLGLDDGFPVDPFTGIDTFAAVEYNSFVQMADFTGIGKPYDTRWTMPNFQEFTMDGGERVRSNTWNNMTPQITMTSLGRPGGSSGSMATYTYPNPPGTITPPIRFPYVFDAPYQGNSLTTDFNGSGYTGLAFGYIQIGWYANIASNQSADFTLCLSTGRALDCGVRQKYSGGNYRSVSAIGNFVGDGMASVMVRPLVAMPNGRPVPGGAVEMCRVTGDDTTGGTGTADNNINCVPWTGLQLPENAPGAAIDQVYFMDLLGTGRTQLVYYHSGSYVSGAWREDGRWEIFEPIDVAADGQALDRLVRVTNGLGAIGSVEYVDGLSTGIVSNTGKKWTYPQQALTAPGKVIRKLTVSNGGDNVLSRSYKYFDNANDMLGRGSLGYGALETKDEQTGFITTTTLSQTWPMIGMKLLESTKAGICEIARAEMVSVITQQFALASGAATVLALPKNQTNTQKDLACKTLATVTTENTYDDAWGNITNQVATTVGGGETFKTTKATTFKNDEALWLLKLPKNVTVAKTTPTITAQEARTVDHEYDPLTGAPSKDIVETGDVKYKLTTGFHRNAFGLVETTSQSWLDVVGAAVSRALSEVIYDARGRYPATVKNALGQIQTHNYYPATGAQKSLMDANALTTSWRTDGFGRVQAESHPDGNETRTYLKQCAGECVAGAVTAQIVDSFRGAERIAVPQVSYADSAGHVLRSSTWGFDGTQIVVDQSYDARGRLFEKKWPRFVLATAYSESRQTYDDLNRPLHTTSWDEAGVAHDSTVDYDGYETTLTNLLGYKRVESRDALNRIKKVTDPKLGVTQFDYEAFGSLAKTIDPNLNVITIKYDRLGRRTHLYDPDLGHIEYIVDAPGRMFAQISPKQRAASGGAAPTIGSGTNGTTFHYDVLDRMVDRYESDLTSHWTFDVSAKGVGKLSEATTLVGTAVDYRRIHDYDALARPYRTRQTLSDGTYLSMTEYDGWGRVLRQTYQRNADSTKVFENRYRDGTGFLRSIARNTLILSEVIEKDASLRTTKERLGNGLTQIDNYNKYTSRPQSGNLSTVAAIPRTSESYEYDRIGSVTNRTQYWEQDGYAEDFTYDEIGRIKSSSVQKATPQDFTYDAVGNLKSKTGIGTGNYDYGAQGSGASRPHAVKSIPGIGTFNYDDNGNMLDGKGRKQTWTSFDMPLMICTLTKMDDCAVQRAGSKSAVFVYGPEHQRTRQIRGDSSWVTYAGAQEVETIGGQVTVKTYWPGGIGVEIDRPTASATELNWMHVDRLGSIFAITDVNGGFREQLAYDAWGKRRTLNGLPLGESATPDDIDGKTDNRGFTGHEMLDQLDLVHMNGRVYDPFIARVLSADSIVQDPLNGQSYNRYSYVLNNPTNFTDPTGFESECTESSPCKPQTVSQPPPLPPDAEIPKVVVTGDKIVKAATNPQPNAKLGGAAVMSVMPVAAPIGIGVAASPPVVKVIIVAVVTYFVYKIWQGKKDKEKNAPKANDSLNGDKSGLPKDPDDLEDQGYEETSHPDAAKHGHRSFENKDTGDKVRHDEGKPGQPGHEGQDHYHRYNPDSTGKGDQYLDKSGKATPRGSDASHLYGD